MDAPPCRMEQLSAGLMAAIMRCSCGSIHVTVGCLSVRLTEDGLREMQRQFTRAVFVLDDRTRRLQESLGVRFKPAPEAHP